MISRRWANEAGAGIEFTDGTSIKWIASINKTFVTARNGEVDVHEGRVGC